MPNVEQSQLKKKEFVTLKNSITGEIIKVIFPSGIQVGVPGATNFNSGIILPNLSFAPSNTTNTLYAVNGVMYFNGSAIGSGGATPAPSTATYVTLTTDATLTNERTLAAGLGLTLTDGGAGNSITLNVGAGTDITVNADDVQVNRSTLATAFAGNGLSDAGSSLAVNPGNGIKIVTDAVTIDNSVVATVSGTTFTGDVYFTNLFVSGNTRLGDASSDSLQITANSWFDNNLNISGSVVIGQDLTVNGTTTTINTTNLTVKDPLIYFGSGSRGTNNNGGIALASGSSTADQSLVWGRVANDTWGAGKQDVSAGASTDLTGMTLSPIRASKFEIGGSRAYVSSSNALTLELSAYDQVLILSGGSASSTNARNQNDTNFFVSGSIASNGTSTRGTAVFGGDIVVSGSMYSLQCDANSILSSQVFG